MTERIIVNGISKKFKIGFKKNQSFLERIISLFSGREPKKTLQALNNVSFNANAGEIIGIIGENGSGKSTLLRTIAGIYQQDEGEIKTYGKIISLINLNIGLQNRLTMRDNIFLCGSLFGLSNRDVKSRLDSIVEFCGLKDFVNTKLYQFSEGMKARLAFSIAIHCNSEILLLDEVFEVGDEEFRNKSANKIKELVKKGVCVVLVSHDMNLIKKHCDKVIWMEEGRDKKKGKAGEVFKRYLKIG